MEVMFALVLLGMFAAFAITRLSSQMSHQRVNRAATVLAGDLHYAQQLAVKQRAPVDVIVDSAAISYRIRDRKTGTVFRTRPLGGGTAFAIQELKVSAGPVMLFPNGVALQTNDFTIGLNGYRRTVRLSRAGQVRVQ